MRFFIDLNRDVYDSLSKEKRGIIDGILAENVAELNKRTAEKQTIMQMMLETPTASWSGLDLGTLTLEEATKIAQQEKAKLALKEQAQKIETEQELGAANPDINVVKEEDAAGNVTVTGINKKTGAQVYQTKSPTAQAVYDNPALLNNYTPTEKGKILNELAKSGQDLTRFSIEKVTAAQRTEISLFDEIITESNNAKFVLEKGLNLIIPRSLLRGYLRCTLRGYASGQNV